MIDDRLPYGATESTYSLDRREIGLLLALLRRVEPSSDDEKLFRGNMLLMLETDINDLDSEGWGK